MKLTLLEHPSIEHRPIVALTSASEPNLIDHFVSILADGFLSTDVKEAEQVQRKSSCFWLSEDKKLYVFTPNDIAGILAELNEGFYSSHLGGRSLSH